jgi:hypothetical protein
MNFDASRLRRSDQIIGGSAIAFFIFLFFFHWYGGSSSTPLGSTSGGDNGWHTFSNSRWIWLITIIVALVAVAVASGALNLKSPVSLSTIVTGLAALSTLLIFYRIIHHPHGGVSGSIGGVHYSASYGIKIGIWLGLIAAALLTYGGYLAMQSEGTSLADVREQASGALSNLSAQAGGSGAGHGDKPATPPAPAPATAPPPPPAAETAAPPIPPPVVEPPPADSPA